MSLNIESAMMLKSFERAICSMPKRAYTKISADALGIFNQIADQTHWLENKPCELCADLLQLKKDQRKFILESFKKKSAE